MRLGLQLGLAMQQGGAPLSNEQIIAAYLSGTKGSYVDFSNAANLEQSLGVPVALVNDPVGRATSLYGTTSYVWTQAAGQRGLWTGSGGGVDFDGTDDQLNNEPTAIFRDVAAYVACVSFKVDTLAATICPLYFSADLGGNPRLGITIAATGAVTIAYRRLDADATTNINLGAGTIVAGTQYTLYTALDFVANTSDVRLNGTQVANPALSGSGNSSNTDGARGLLAASHSGQRFNGKLGRVVLGISPPSAGQRTAMEALVGGVTL